MCELYFSIGPGRRWDGLGAGHGQGVHQQEEPCHTEPSGGLLDNMFEERKWVWGVFVDYDEEIFYVTGRSPIYLFMWNQFTESVTLFNPNLIDSGNNKLPLIIVAVGVVSGGRTLDDDITIWNVLCHGQSISFWKCPKKENGKQNRFYLNVEKQSLFIDT